MSLGNNFNSKLAEIRSVALKNNYTAAGYSEDELPADVKSNIAFACANMKSSALAE